MPVSTSSALYVPPDQRTDPSTRDLRQEGLTFEEIHEQHQIEAFIIRGRTDYSEGPIRGDILVRIDPPLIVREGDTPMTLGEDIRYYLYRRNPETGLYNLVPRQ